MKYPAFHYSSMYIIVMVINFHIYYFIGKTILREGFEMPIFFHLPKINTNDGISQNQTTLITHALCSVIKNAKLYI